MMWVGWAFLILVIAGIIIMAVMTHLDDRQRDRALRARQLQHSIESAVLSIDGIGGFSVESTQDVIAYLNAHADLLTDWTIVIGTLYRHFPSEPKIVAVHHGPPRIPGSWFIVVRIFSRTPHARERLSAAQMEILHRTKMASGWIHIELIIESIPAQEPKEIVRRITLP